MLKTSSKNKNAFSRVSSIQNQHISVQKLAKKSCELCCYADENVDMLSVTMPDGNRLLEGAYSHLPMGL